MLVFSVSQYCCDVCVLCLHCWCVRAVLYNSVIVYMSVLCCACAVVHDKLTLLRYCAVYALRMMLSAVEMVRALMCVRIHKDR
jgi:hypothetical protein